MNTQELKKLKKEMVERLAQKPDAAREKIVCAITAVLMNPKEPGMLRWLNKELEAFHAFHG